MNGFIHFLNCFDLIKDDATQSTSSNPPLIPIGQLHWCWAPLLTPSGRLKNINMPPLLIGLEICLHFLFTDLQHTGIKLPNFCIAMPNQSKFNQPIIPHTLMPVMSQTSSRGREVIQAPYKSHNRPFLLWGDRSNHHIAAYTRGDGVCISPVTCCISHT